MLAKTWLKKRSKTDTRHDESSKKNIDSETTPFIVLPGIAKYEVFQIGPSFWNWECLGLANMSKNML